MKKIPVSIGIGLHKLPLDQTSQLLTKAVDLGFSYFDAALSYQAGRAHSILSHLAQSFPRQISASTKIGFIPEDDKPYDFDSSQCVQNMCLDPHFFYVQMEKLAKELRGIHLKTVFIHNPDIHRKRLNEKKFLEALKYIFEILEQGVQKGYLENYGIATYTGFENADLNLEELIELAHDVAGSQNHFKAIQLPSNLVSIKPIFQAYHEHKGVLIQAQNLGIKVHASSALARGYLPKIVGPELAHWIRPGCSPAIACWLVVASCPWIEVMLTSPSCLDQLEEYKAFSQLSPLSQEEVEKITLVLMTGQIESG